MSEQLLGTIFGNVIVAVIAVVGTIVASRMNRRGAAEAANTTATSALITQLQADVASLRSSLNDSHQRERVRDDYIHKLRDHIASDKPPPPPPWPEELTR